jgi:hypothetical protein
MIEEPFGWLFVGTIPLLYERNRVAKQVKIETWLNLAQVIKELGIEESKTNQCAQPPTGYIV